MSNILYRLSYLFLRFYAAVMLRLEIRRLADLPPGPKLFVANHPSATDPFLIHLASPSPLSVLISANAFAVPVFGDFLRSMRQIPVQVGEGRSALEEAVQALKAGRSVALFPEGDFSPREGGLREPRTGAARLALTTGVPVIPVGIHLDARRSLTIRSKIGGKQRTGYWYLHGPYRMTVGQALRFQGDAADPEQVRNISTRIMDAIREMAAQSAERGRRRRLSPVLP